MFAIALSLLLATAGAQNPSARPTDTPAGKAADRGPRFPFGWTPATTFEDLAGLHATCRDPRPDGSVLCYLQPAEGRQVDAGAFRPRDVSVEYTPKAGTRVLTEVTLYAEQILDCDDLLAAVAAAVASAEEEFGKPRRVRKGPRYRSGTCDDYVREDAVQWVGEYKGWRVRVDSFFTRDAYTVYRSVVNLDNEAAGRGKKGAGKASGAR